VPRTYSRLITTPSAARAFREEGRPFVSLTTDFGLRDPSAAICKGVVHAIAPDALVVDISHEVEKYRVRDGALLLWCALPYMPIGAHMAVVDPGVGTSRRAVAIETARGDVLLGPDNGLLIPGAERLGGIIRAHVIESHEYRLPVVSSTFHGRDLFAPAAAHVALGVPVDSLGAAIDPRTLERLVWPAADVGRDELVTSVVYVDTFGSLKLGAEADDVLAAFGRLQPGEPLELQVAANGSRSRSVEVRWVETFAQVPVGQPLVYEDSYGRIAVALNQGRATDALGIDEDASIRLRRT
jgi:S-adenosylmethionine hydrolase